MNLSTNDWPDIPLHAWSETYRALHLWTQVVGKYRLARTPWLNHSWHATLYVDARGLTSGPVPDAAGIVEVRFDLREHALLLQASSGVSARFALEPMAVAAFDRRFRDSLTAIGATPIYHGRPNEIPDPTPFALDERVRPYDRGAVERLHRALVLVAQVFNRFRTAFIGKTSPVHLFWGSFDLAVTRFSGRTAPAHPGGLPHLPDAITREAYSHEVSSAGFWPGGPGAEYPLFYSYAYPTPAGFADARVQPAEASFDRSLGEFVLPYDAVRAASRPEQTLRVFLESTYAAAADLGNWDRAALECEPGEPLRPRSVHR